MNDRIIYFALTGLITIFSLTGATISLFNYPTIGIAFVGFAIALIPLASHMRMRRFLASLIRKLPKSAAITTANNDAQFKALSSKIEDLTLSLDLANRKVSLAPASESDRAARDLQREARALRLTLREIEGLSSTHLSSIDQNPEIHQNDTSNK